MGSKSLSCTLTCVPRSPPVCCECYVFLCRLFSKRCIAFFHFPFLYTSYCCQNTKIKGEQCRWVCALISLHSVPAEWRCFQYKWNKKDFIELQNRVWLKIKELIIHQVMNCFSERGNCFNALLETIGDVDLWGGRQICCRENCSDRTEIMYFFL